MIATLLCATLLTSGGWRSVEISFYSGGHKTADGTRMSNNGNWVATRAFPLGSTVEIRYGKKTMILQVKDKTAKHTAHRADLPKNTWKKFGAPTGRGILKGHWRLVTKKAE